MVLWNSANIGDKMRTTYSAVLKLLGEAKDVEGKAC